MAGATRTRPGAAVGDGAAVLGGTSLRVRLTLLAVALCAVALAACQHDASPDPFIGPSELGLSLALSASPDVLPLDGASQSLVTIFSRDGAGQAIANVTLRLQIRFGGVLQDVGLLSARTLVTGQDGRALATYTAPIGGSVDTGSTVEIIVTPVGDNYTTAVPRSLTIRLVPRGIVIPTATFTAGFQFTPTSPTELEDILFDAVCPTGTTTNCVNDPDGQVATYAWDFGDGNSGSGPTVTRAYSTASNYTVLLTVTDAYDRTATATRLIGVASPGTPTASFTVSPSSSNLGDTVFFNASGSTAPAGRTIVSYDWTFGDGGTVSGVTVSHGFAVAATYSVTLRVTDNRGASASTTQSVTVTTNQPTASFVFSPVAPTTSSSVFFNATASGPAAGSGRSITSYAWNFGDGTDGTSVTTSHTFATPGVYNVVLTVTDSPGESATTSAQVTVIAATSGTPTASFVFSPAAPTTATLVQFNAAASVAPTGRTITLYAWNFGDGSSAPTGATIAGYAWNFGDSSTSTGVTPKHTFATAGVYNVVLTVTDSAGRTGTTTKTVTVVGGTSTLPTASFTASPSPTPLGTLTVVDATASTASNGATIASYTWNFGDTTATTTCPGGAGCVVATPQILSHTYTTKATYTITLTVTDSLGQTGTTTQTLTVSDP